MQDRQRPRIGPAWQAVLSDIRQLAGTTARAANADVARRLPEHAAAVVSDARDLAEAMTVAGDRAARRIPGYAETVEQLRRAEASVLREIKQRLDDLAEATDEAGDSASARSRLLEQLLTASLGADPNRSRERLHLRILRSLVPDEARILAALSDGSQFPLVHVETRGGTRTVLANASTVGRVAGVHLQTAVPVYVGHLRDLGLLEEGPKDDALSDQYALLVSENYVRRALEESGEGLRGNKAVQRTLRLSALGRELWDACRPEEPTRHLAGTNGSAPESYRSAYAGTRRTDPGRTST
ncbi:MAG TPA: Abi-alpha family protein [Pseudonocardia sp.]